MEETKKGVIWEVQNQDTSILHHKGFAELFGSRMPHRRETDR